MTPAQTLGSGDRVRPKVVIGAYACGPEEGPEASAGWAFAVAAAENNDVWVYTRERFRPRVSAALAADPLLAQRLNVVYLDLSPRALRLKRRSWDLYWYYALWQRQLGREAARLHGTVNFDVAHHITFANDWMPCGIGRLDVPLVWGPVGGASAMPFWKLRKWLGWRGFATELARQILTPLPRLIWGQPTAARAAVVVAQNPSVAHRFRAARNVIVEPNAALQDDLPVRLARAPAELKTALFVGRLLAWKGARLAIAVLARPEASDWKLVVYGTGYERAVLERLAGTLDVADRIEFAGHRPRAEVLDAYTTADALLFPSMHDQAGWVAAEASSIGCPVVCLPLGGPATMAERNAFVASLDGDIVGNLARKLQEAGEHGGVAHDRWRRDRLAGLLTQWYALARLP